MSAAETSINVTAMTADSDAQVCARMMAESEPWVTLGRGYEASLAILRDASKERYVARAGGEVVGFLILNMGGALAGYIQTVCVAEKNRGQGIGARLMAFAEERIFRDSPNVFLCVSSFNAGARRLYDRLGYRVVGELADYLVAGHSETLMRKTIGSLTDFRKKAG
ncbi:MAG TPA: GNAT family N-acetyltransferase [Thermoanaerobaculia bacterium]|jgi:ribosomal-protein-alanine N-acetyltransferase|nr:GNAT family N-acetyltransferase [Thermoanaerobaculia bacterium]